MSSIFFCDRIADEQVASFMNTKYLQTGNAFTADKYVASLLIKIYFEVTIDIPYRQYAGFYY